MDTIPVCNGSQTDVRAIIPGAGESIKRVSEEEIESFYYTHSSKNLHGIKRNCLHSAVCLYTMTTDDHFILDWHPQSQRVLLVSACSGHGFKHSAAVGQAAAELTLHGQSVFDVSPFRLDRFATA